MSKTTLLDIKRVGSLPEPTNIITTGSGESNFLLSSMATELTVGSLNREPGRIYVDGRNLKTAGEVFYINGVNTPWHYWNEFGAPVYDYVWWDSEFQRMQQCGVNAVRVWLSCDGALNSLQLDADGTCNGPTSDFWDDVDSLMTLCETYQIYIIPTLFSFDHFSWNKENSERWHLMIGNEEKLDTLIENYIVALVNRYKNNKYVLAVDLCNEIDGLAENADVSTPRNTLCTPVGNGSKTVSFDKRVSDYVVGQSLYINGEYMGDVTERVSDYVVTCTNGYSGASETFIAGDWMFTGMNWTTIQRYVAKAAAAVHRSESPTLVSVGVMIVKWSSNTYDGDYYSDSALYNITQDSLSKLDIYQIHWYPWAEPWYQLAKSPQEHGLGEKPAIMGEMPAHWARLNIPSINSWAPDTTYSLNSFIWKDDNGVQRKYKCVQSGTSGLDVGPTGEGTNIADGTILWDYVTNTWEPNQTYSSWSMVLNDSESTSGAGRLYLSQYGGTSDVSGGPTGTSSSITDGTITWKYIRDACTNEKDMFTFLINNGWAGHMPWTSNNVDINLGMYEVGYGYPSEYIENWEASTEYAVLDVVSNDGHKMYRCITAGTSDSISGPTGTGSDIIDGTVHWSYVKTLEYVDGAGYLTSFGKSLIEFKNEHTSMITPSISGVSSYNDGSVIRQSKERAWYVAGTDIQSIISFSAETSANANLTQNIGMFDNDDGLFLKIYDDPLKMAFVIRSANSETVIQQTSWNIDKFDGTGPSAIALNPGYVQFLVIEFGWMHGGKNRFGFFINGKIWWAHEIYIGNTEQIHMPTNPSLPLRWEINVTDNVSDKKTLKAYYGSAIATSNDMVRYKNITSNRLAAAADIGSSATREVIALRVPTENAKYTVFKPTRLSISFVQSSAALFNWKLVLNPELTSDSSWYPINGSLLNMSINRSVQNNTGILISNGYATTYCSIDLPKNIQYITGDENGDSDILSFQIYNIDGGYLWYFVSIEWEELK